MKAYSLDLRQRIAAALRNAGKEQEIADRFGVSLSTVQRIDRLLRRQQCLAPKPRPGRAPRMGQQEQEAFAAMLAGRTDWTIRTMAAAWHERTGLLLARSTLYDLLGRLDWRFKKRAGRPRRGTSPGERLSGNG